MAKGPSIIDRLMRRGKEKESDDSTTEKVDPEDSQGTIDDAASDDTADDQATESGDIVSDGSEDDAEVADDAAIQTGDGATGTSGDISDGTETGDAIADDSSGVIVTGDAASDEVDGDSPSAGAPQELDDQGIGAFLRSRERVRFDPAEESELEQQAREIQEVTEPQLDPALIEARFAAVGPEPPDPDDGAGDLGFGEGASPLDTDGLEPIESAEAELDSNPLQPMPRFTVDDLTVDGIDADEVAPTAAEPAGGAPPDDGYGPYDIAIDDTSDHSEPTEVNIDD